MFKERFLELMKINNVKNYKSVSESTNIPMSTISHWLHESKNPNMDNLIALANLFDVTIDFLIGRDPVYDANTVGHGEYSQEENIAFTQI